MQPHPLANFPFKVVLDDGTIYYSNMLSFTHGALVTLSVKGGYYTKVEVGQIHKIEVEDRSKDYA